MAAEYSQSHGLANLTIGAPGFDSNDCVSKNEVGFRDINVQGFNTQQNLRVPETHSSACLPMRVYGIEAAHVMTTPNGPLCDEEACNAKMYRLGSLSCVMC